MAHNDIGIQLYIGMLLNIYSTRVGCNLKSPRKVKANSSMRGDYQPSTLGRQPSMTSSGCARVLMNDSLEKISCMINIVS